MQKNELIKQAEKLQKELDILKDKINLSDDEDIFSVTKYSQVCLKLKEKELKLEDFNFIKDFSKRIKSLAFAKIQQIESYFNGNWKPDWSDTNQRKWYPYFEYKRSGGWCLCGVCSYGYGSFGEPAFFKDEETARHIVNQKEFMDIYKDYLNN